MKPLVRVHGRADLRAPVGNAFRTVSRSHYLPERTMQPSLNSDRSEPLKRFSGIRNG
jgi:hypothetical protein